MTEWRSTPAAAIIGSVWLYAYNANWIGLAWGVVVQCASPAVYLHCLALSMN